MSCYGAKKLVVNNFSSSQRWSSFDKYLRQLADVNKDGDADIGSFSSYTVYIALAQSNGTFP